jgi:hypothetical protein
MELGRMRIRRIRGEGDGVRRGGEMEGREKMIEL